MIQAPQDMLLNFNVSWAATVSIVVEHSTAYYVVEGLNPTSLLQVLGG
jgi:hypothetical protein